MGNEYVAQYGDRLVYCKGCGQLAGIPTRCPVYSGGEHGFVTSDGPVVCKGCGAIPGKGTKCPVYSGGEHDFRVLR
jgi:hypothetical protein